MKFHPFVSIVFIFVFIVGCTTSGQPVSSGGSVPSDTTVRDASIPSPDSFRSDVSDVVNSARPNPSVSESRGVSALYQGEVLAGEKSLLLDFTQADYDAAITSGKLVVLYFYASWCPLCREEFPLMEAAFDELDVDDVVGFRVNFNDGDTDKDERALARAFGVGYQHTKVFVRNGERVLKSPESWDKARYLREITLHRGE